MTRSVSQASRRNIQTPRRLRNVYSSAKVRSRVYRPNGLVKRLDTYQVSNINKDAFQQGFHNSEVFQKILHCLQVRKFGSLSTVQTPGRPRIIRPDDVTFRPDAPLCREASVPAYSRPDVSAARPDAP
jgi:hypothetical protein